MSSFTESDETITLADAQLPGSLFMPEGPVGIVLFSHGTGSGRRSPRNRYVAERLASSGIAALLFDLLTDDEDRDPDNRFDIGLLAGRLSAMTDWVLEQEWGGELPIGYFGASAGSAAAFKVATTGRDGLRAIVSRGGRPDLVLSDLKRVAVPTLLIVGGADYQIRQHNERAFGELHGAKRLEIVPEATHLFEEPGALERVADLAIDWYLSHLSGHESRHESKHESERES